jgi:Nucleoside 2-deoxyribosyltransferase
MSGLRIYLAFTVRGDRSRLGRARRIRSYLESLGHRVLTAHLLDDDVEAAEAALTDRQIFERDLTWLQSADAVVAEASGSSFGVGFEVGYTLARAERSGQRVVVLYDPARSQAISRLIPGLSHPAATVAAYGGDEDIERALLDALGHA